MSKAQQALTLGKTAITTGKAVAPLLGVSAWSIIVVGVSVGGAAYLITKIVDACNQLEPGKYKASAYVSHKKVRASLSADKKKTS